MVDRRHLVQFFVVMVDDEVLDGALEDGVRKFHNLILSLEVKDGVRTGPDRLLIFLEDGILDILNIRLVDQNDLTILECFKFLHNPTDTYISLLLSMKS